MRGQTGNVVVGKEEWAMRRELDSSQRATAFLFRMVSHATNGRFFRRIFFSKSSPTHLFRHLYYGLSRFDRWEIM